MIEKIIVLFIAYILGSIPFGYLITKFSTKKNLLEIGWKKNSGSNVMKNVGKWQGALTFILDVAKGFAAVYIAQYLGLSIYIQVLCGVLSVIGHNWSLFLGFNGGRGLAALLGALIAISPMMAVAALIPCIILTIIWTASIGTLFSFLTVIVYCFNFNGSKAAGFLMLISLIPVLIKRLSPIQDVIDNPNNRILIENRLIFDQDTVPPIRLGRKK